MTPYQRSVDPRLAELLRAELFDSRTAVQRSRIIEGLVRVVYEHVKFQVVDDQAHVELNGVAVVLAAAAAHVHQSSRPPGSDA